VVFACRVFARGNLRPWPKFRSNEMVFSESLLPEFDEEMKNTRALLERVPDNNFDYQPHPKSMTLGRLAGHVAELPGWGLTTTETDLLELDPSTFKPWIPATTAEILQTFDKNVAKARAAIANTSDEKWGQTWTMKFAGNTIMSLPRSSVMRATVMSHIIHHRAQLGVYLRLRNVEIPGMYGPSADEMKFWQAPSPE
jgi:uncharacterized damage-inducible protein DinB